MRRRSLTMVVFAGLAVVAAATASRTAAALTLSSPAFAAGKAIPVRYTCDGAGDRPKLRWSGAPRGTRGFAILVDDPDSVVPNFLKPDEPVGDPYVHWIGWGIPGAATSISAKAPFEGRNGSGKVGWTPPCPQNGTHGFTFRLYALGEPLELKVGATRKAFIAAIKGRVLAKTTLVGRYHRP